MFIVYSL